VLPRTFRDLEASADRDLWLSPNTWTWIGGDPGEFQARDFRWFEMIGRRKPELSVATANAEMVTLATSFKSAFPSSSTGRGARVISDFDYRMERGSVSAKAMLALVLLVVLIACVNVANLLLARAGARSHELAVRLSLGAPRWRIMRELASETVLLGVLGASGGLLVAYGLIQLLPALLPPPPGMRAMIVFRIDIRVAMFTAAVAAMTVVLFGIAPAWLAGRTDVVSAFKGGRGESVRDSALKRALVVTQVAISIVLLCVAAALSRSFIATSRADIGFARKPLLTLWTVFSSEKGPTIGEAVRQLRAIPGVTNVALAVRAPLSLSGGGMARRVTIPGVPADASLGPANVKFNAVSSNYFDVFGTRIIRGRPFSPEEERAGEPTVVVSKQFARQFFEGRDPLEQIIEIAGHRHRIVGIAQDGIVNEIGEARQPYMYLPFRRADYGETTFVLETAGDPAPPTAAARAALRRLHPSLEPRRAITMKQYVDHALSLHRATAALTSILALAGLLLTAVGVYGVTAYRTTRRIREIGIRIALGAMRGQVLRLVLRDGLKIGAMGIAIGLPFALAGAKLISALLVDIEPWDAPSFAIAVAFLLFAIAIATWIPARRAAKVEPSSALRHAAN
jgi:putative ABC transport system permease protein